jgi:hypothetical protein
MRTIHWTLSLLLALAALTGRAQEGQEGEEHRYQFQVNGELSAYTEKLLLESMSGFDPAMRVDIDRPTRAMKVLAYRSLDPQAVVDLAAQFGVALAPRRLHPAPRVDNPIQ